MKWEHFSVFRPAVIVSLVAACAGLRTVPAAQPPTTGGATGEGSALWVASHAEFLTQDQVPRAWWEPTDGYLGPHYYLVATGGEICKVADARLWTMAIEGLQFTCAWRHPHE
jgi:hypothetical protein